MNGLREQTVLAAQVAVLRRRVDAGPDGEGESTEFARGALDALVWLTRGGPAPLAGALALVPVEYELVVAEMATAEAIIHGRPSKCRDYARGVQHALMWARCATAAPPLPDRQGAQPPPVMRPSPSTRLVRGVSGGVSPTEEPVGR
jgi:hypothetical protein